MTEYARLVVAVDSTQVGKADTAIKKLGDTSSTTESRAGSLGKTLMKLAAPLAAFVSVRAVIRASDEYGQMAARMRMATSSAEEYNMVQDRLIDTANRTYRPLQEAQELYIRTADALKALGNDTAAALDITDSFSYLLVTNAASADRAASAVNAYSKAIQTGKVDSESWQSILAAMPTIVESIAEATGRTTQEIRELGITGKLSLEGLNESLRRSAETNGLLADSMETSVADAIVTLQNSFSVLVGKTNETTGATSGLITAIESMAELLQDPDTAQGIADIASALVTLTSWLLKAASATANFFDDLTDGLAGIRNLTELERMREEVLSLQYELNEVNASLLSPDWMLAIRGLDRDELASKASELRLRMQGLKATLGDMEGEKSLKALDAGLDAVLSSLGGFGTAGKAIGAVAAETEKADKSVNKLANSYKSMTASLEREIALYGQTGEASAVAYELKSGALKGIIGEQADYLMGLAKELDYKNDLSEQERRRIDILRESGQLRAANDAQFELEYAQQIAEYERQGNQEALQRLETLRQIRAIQIESAIEPGTVEGVSRAPDSQGADAMFGGAAGEFAKLEEERIRLDEWRATELEMQRAFLEAKAINEQEYAERVRNIQEQHATELMDIDAARQQVALTAAESMFGDMADLTKQFAGENSAIYKTMFAVEKGIAIARALVAIQTGIALAAANPFPANLAAMATVAASTAGLVSNIASIASFEGGGSTGNGPRVGGLDGKGGYMAMVHPKETIIDHTKSGGPYGGKGGGTTINLIEDASRAGQMQERQAPGMDGKQITDVFVANIRKGGAARKAIADAFGLKDAAR